MILLIDNYDSFVHNLARYFRELGCQTQTVRNDSLTIDQIRQLHPQAIVLSPGPCSPAEAGISLNVVRELQGEYPILGVCLGHQAIAAALGGEIIRAPEPIHGRTSWVRHAQTELFDQIPTLFRATRYHSLIVDEGTLPSTLTITARTSDQIPMAIESAPLRLYGVQFHPESILTQYGHQLLRNFLQLAGCDNFAQSACPAEPASPSRPVWRERAPIVSPVPWPAPLDDGDVDGRTLCGACPG